MKPIILALITLVCIGLSATPVLCREKVKVAGTELEQWLSTYTVYAGTNDLNGCVFMVVSHSADRRERYVDCPGNPNIKSKPYSATTKGTARVEGDRLCETWMDAYPGWEICEDVYQIEAFRYEQFNGTKTFYKLK